MLITNASIVTWEESNKIIENGAIAIHDGAILETGPDSDLKRKYADEDVLDAHGSYVMPGNICAHTHFYGAFARGMAIPGEAPKGFVEILEKLWWPLDRSLGMEAIKYSALVCQVDAIRHGTTTLIDHHASPNALEGSLDEIRKTVEASGLRVALSYEVTDRDGMEKAEAGIAENARFIHSLIDRPDPHLRATFGLHASLTLSDETLKKARKSCPDDIGMHIHVAEGLADEEDSLRKTKMRVANRLNRHGILNEHAILAHAVHVDDEEMDLINRSGAWVTHQPRSNMNNAVGLPRIEKMMEMGIKVGLGNDGFSNAMWEEWKAAYLSAHRKAIGDDRIAQRIAIWNDMGSIQQLPVLESAQSALLAVGVNDPLPENPLMEAYLNG